MITAEYGQTKHDLEEEEELEDKVEDAVEDLGRFPRKLSSALPSVGIGVKIPDTMARLNQMNKNFTMKVPDTSDYHPAQIHDSTPWKTSIPKTPPGKTTPCISINHNSMDILGKQKRKKN